VSTSMPVFCISCIMSLLSKIAKILAEAVAGGVISAAQGTRLRRRVLGRGKAEAPPDLILEGCGGNGWGHGNEMRHGSHERP